MPKWLSLHSEVTCQNAFLPITTSVNYALCATYVCSFARAIFHDYPCSRKRLDRLQPGGGNLFTFFSARGDIHYHYTRNSNQRALGSLSSSVNNLIVWWRAHFIGISPLASQRSPFSCISLHTLIKFFTLKSFI